MQYPNPTMLRNPSAPDPGRKIYLPLRATEKGRTQVQRLHRPQQADPSGHATARTVPPEKNRRTTRTTRTTSLSHSRRRLPRTVKRRVQMTLKAMRSVPASEPERTVRARSPARRISRSRRIRALARRTRYRHLRKSHPLQRCCLTAPCPDPTLSALAPGSTAPRAQEQTAATVLRSRCRQGAAATRAHPTAFHPQGKDKARWLANRSRPASVRLRRCQTTRATHFPPAIQMKKASSARCRVPAQPCPEKRRKPLRALRDL